MKLGERDFTLGKKLTSQKTLAVQQPDEMVPTVKYLGLNCKNLQGHGSST